MSGTSTLNKIPLTMIEDIDKIGVGTKLLPDGDWNNALDNGIYTSTSYSENENAPMDGWLIGHVMAYDDNYVFQELINYTSGNFEHFTRSKVGGVWGEWRDVDSELNSYLAQGNQLVTFKKTSNQAIATAVATEITWDNLDIYQNATYASLDNQRIHLEKGIYRLDLTVTFTLNNTGVREVQIGTSNAVATQAVSTTSGNATVVQLNTIFIQERDGNLSLKAFQNSGASISLSTIYTQANIQKVGDVL